MTKICCILGTEPLEMLLQVQKCFVAMICFPNFKKGSKELDEISKDHFVCESICVLTIIALSCI